MLNVNPFFTLSNLLTLISQAGKVYLDCSGQGPCTNLVLWLLARSPQGHVYNWPLYLLHSLTDVPSQNGLNLKTYIQLSLVNCLFVLQFYGPMNLWGYVQCGQFT